MKKIIFTLLCLSILFSCTTKESTTNKNVKLEENKDAKSVILDNFVGSYCKGNYVWGLAMNLAWQELNNEILHEKLILNTEEKDAIEIAKAFNYTKLSRKDIDEASYYVKAGYGQKTVDAINKESRKKFPKKSFKDLEIKLSPADIISYAYFLKEVEYKEPLYKTNVDFMGKTVKGFYADTNKQKSEIKVIAYENDDKFIISLKLKSDGDELLFAKGYDMKKPQAVLDYIAKTKPKGHLKKRDYFEAPNLHLNYHRSYSEMTGKFLANKDFTQYFIGQMFENIKFDMDEKGARVENEAVITLLKSAAPSVKEEKPRYFILDKPYWIIMKRSNSKNPYFILGVNNTKLMEEKK